MAERGSFAACSVIAIMSDDALQNSARDNTRLDRGSFTTYSVIVSTLGSCCGTGYRYKNVPGTDSNSKLQKFFFDSLVSVRISTLAPYFVIAVLTSALTTLPLLRFPSLASLYIHASSLVASFLKWQVNRRDPAPLNPLIVAWKEPRLEWAEALGSQS
jgi:hypothetical protein